MKTSYLRQLLENILRSRDSLLREVLRRPEQFQLLITPGSTGMRESAQFYLLSV